MKKILLLHGLLVLAIFVLSSRSAYAQPACPAYSGYSDPLYLSAPNSSMNKPTNASSSPAANNLPQTGSCSSDAHFVSFNSCLASSSTVGPLYTYTLYQGVQVVYGAMVKISGGWVTNINFTTNDGTTQSHGGSIPYPFNTNSQELVGSTSLYMTEVQIQVRWTSASATNSLEFYGYNSSMGLNTFYAMTVNSSAAPSQPAEPTVIYTGSPVCSVPGWSIDPGGSSGNLYTWGYYGGPNQGGQMGVYPNANYPYAEGPVIPNNSSSSVTVTLSLSAQSYTSCATSTSSATNHLSVTIPGDGSCSGGGGWFGRAAPGLSTSDSIAALEFKNNVFPNPASNSVNVSFDKPGRHTIELVTVLGQVLKKIEDNTEDRLLVDVSALPKGVYFIVIYENKLISSRKKIIVQ